MGAFRSLTVSLTIFLALVALVFSLLPLLAGLHTSILRDWYYIRIETANLITTSTTPFAPIINAIAGELGLEGYYQSGLWNYCAGDVNSTTSQVEGINYCSPTRGNYWFDPVSIVENDIPNSVSFSVPQAVVDDLGVVKTAQTWLKAVLLVGCIFNFFSLVVCGLGYSSRMGSLFASLVAFIGALFTVTAAVLGQAFGILFKRAINDLDSVGLVASLGTKFYVFLWIGAGASLLCFIFIFMTVCCCAPRRKEKFIMEH